MCGAISKAGASISGGGTCTISETAKGTRYTTTRIWELEREALKTAEQMAKEPRGEAGELVVARVIAARPTLKGDQREMVGRLLAGREGIAVVIGEAETGKSFATVAAAEGWVQAGFELRAAAPCWKGGDWLGRASQQAQRRSHARSGRLHRGRSRRRL